MKIDETYQKYLDRGKWFNPDYEREDELLSSFKAENENLSDSQEKKFEDYLKNDDHNLTHHYFVADLLYYYSDFGTSLMISMLEMAVNYRDPSFNRIFLRPCIRSKKKEESMTWLIEKFKTGTLLERIGISNLYYWLGIEQVDRTELKKLIYHKSQSTNNLIELYFYQLAIGKLGFRIKRIPKDADSLIRKVRGNKDFEKMLIEDLKWEIN